MNIGMAFITECDEIQLGIVSGLAAKLLVVDLQVRHCST
jgi:hypothetical protein